VEEVEACLEILACTVWDESGKVSARCCDAIAACPSHLSPYIRGRFRLGLAVGVRSLTRPACSMCPSAFDSAAASIGSELLSWVAVGKAFWLRLWVAVGGVLDSGGEIRVGVAMSSSRCAFAVAASPESSRAIAMDALYRDRWGAQLRLSFKEGNKVVVG
jgi:hypothetical protein